MNSTGSDIQCLVLDSFGNESVSNVSYTGYNETVVANACLPQPTAMGPIPFTPPPADTSTIIMVLLYGLICVFGLCGNGLVIFVILRYTKMKTVTNMYILNLSIADGTFLLGLPMIITTSILKQWVFGYPLCKIYYIMTCINWFTGAFTLTVMSGDRYLAVCYPITSMRYRTPQYALIAIAFTWILSFIVMLPVILYTKNVPSKRFLDFYSCTLQWPAWGKVPPQTAFISYALLLGFVIPVFLISILYTLLILRLRSTGPHVKSAEKRRSHRKVTKLVTIIILSYIICWLPYWAFQVHLIAVSSPMLPRWKVYVFQVITILSYANSMINPFLYAFTNDNFRESFINAFRCAGDPLLGSRRESEFASSCANNNSFGGSLKAGRYRDEAHTEYEFTTLNTSSSGVEANENN